MNALPHIRTTAYIDAVFRPIVVALTVQEGDTLESLAKSIGIDTDTLITANGGTYPQSSLTTPVRPAFQSTLNSNIHVLYYHMSSQYPVIHTFNMQ